MIQLQLSVIAPRTKIKEADASVQLVKYGLVLRQV